MLKFLHFQRQNQFNNFQARFALLLVDRAGVNVKRRATAGMPHQLLCDLVRCCFSGVRHPQTQGKVERFHGSLERARSRAGAEQWLTQGWLDNFRHEYNQVRPHEALGMRTPASLWRPSTRVYDPNPQAWDCGAGAELRKVGSQGHIYIGDRPWRVSQALASHTVRLERIDQRVLVYFCRTLVQEIDLSGERSTAVERSPLNPSL